MLFLAQIKPTCIFQVVGFMGQAAHNGRVTITVRRRIHHQYSSEGDGGGGGGGAYNGPTPAGGNPSGPPPVSGYPYDVTVTRRETEGFGFVIISSSANQGQPNGQSSHRYSKT